MEGEKVRYETIGGKASGVERRRRRQGAGRMSTLRRDQRSLSRRWYLS